MKLLDTNVIIYAQGAPSPYREPCRAILREAETRPEAYAIDVETLQEVLEVYSRRGERSEAVETAQDMLALFPEPFPVSRAEIEQSLDILGRYRRLSPRDAIHAAVVLTYDLEGIVSGDKAFDRVAALTRFDPRKMVPS